MNSTSQGFNFLDLVTIGLYLLLVIIGFVSIYSADFDTSSISFLNLTDLTSRQLIWFGAAVLIGLGVLFFDSKIFNAAAPVLYIGSIVLLIVVLIFGKEIAGSKSWIRFGSVGIQPSEFAKIGTCMFLAKYMGGREFDFKRKRMLLTSMAIVALPACLIILQGDTGSALVFASFILMFYRAGFWTEIILLALLLIVLAVLALYFQYYWIAGIVSLSFVLFYARYSEQNRKGFVLLIGGSLTALLLPLLLQSGMTLIILFVLFIITLGFYIYYKFDYLGFAALLSFLLFFLQVVDFGYHNVLRAHQKTRVDVLLGKTQDVKGVGYNINQSKIAIGSGGWFGKGFLEGTQTKGNFVPAQKTDFIFCTIAEEWGFLGSLILISLFIGLLGRFIFLAERQKSRFNLLFIYGVVGIFFFHFIVNIGMTIGLFPIIGIPLPFVSYGGSSLLAFSILIFLVLRFDIDRMSVG